MGGRGRQREIAGTFPQLFRGSKPVYQAAGQGRPGTHRLSGQHHLHGGQYAHNGNAAYRAAEAGMNAQFDFWKAELGVLGFTGYAVPAGERQLEPAAEGKSVDHGHCGAG